MSLKSENSKKPILLLVDGHSLAFRSFYAFSKGIDGGLTTKEGFPTSVTYDNQHPQNSPKIEK